LNAGKGKERKGKKGIGKEREEQSETTHPTNCTTLLQKMVFLCVFKNNNNFT